MKHVLGLSLIVVATMFASTNASADEKNVITLKDQYVYGHAIRPTAAIEVNKVRMTLTTLTPTLTAVSKIQDASKKDPF